jgi:hypothetical protein
MKLSVLISFAAIQIMILIGINHVGDGLLRQPLYQQGVQTPVPGAVVTSTATITVLVSSTPSSSSVVTQSGTSSASLVPVVIGGLIGITGAILGAFFTHVLTLRRDRIARERAEQDRLRDKILGGVDEVAMRHGRSKLPFGGGGSLNYPTRQTIDEDALVQDLRNLIAQARESKTAPGKVTELLKYSFSVIQQDLVRNSKSQEKEK